MRPVRAAAKHAKSVLKTHDVKGISKTKPAKKESNKKRSLHGEVKRAGSAHLSAYFKSYNGGLGDFHIAIFRDLKRVTCAQNVLYPGCHRHISASLVFENVVYVDSYAKVKPVFHDEKVLKFIQENKDFEEEPEITFKCKNFEAVFGEQLASFDLLLSLSAGIVSKPCAKYLKSGGYLLASDAHFDARMAFVDPLFDLVAVYDDAKCQFDFSEDAKSGHFLTKKGEAMNLAMVQESINLPKAKRHFKLQKESLFYLFQKK